MLDATIAWDDALCERFLACMQCSQQAGQRSLDLVMVHGRPLLAVRCLRCASQDPGAVQLIARLAARER